MISLQSSLTTAGLVIAVVATSWMAIRNSTIGPLSTQSVLVGQAEDIHITQMKANGLPDYHATVADASQYSDGNTWFNQVVVNVASYTGAPDWILTAPHGKSNGDNSVVNLWNQVDARRPAGNGYKPFTFETKTLTLYPPKNQITTGDPVKFYEPGTQNITTGVGLEANTKTKIIHILSQVESTYEVNSDTPAKQ